MVNLRITGLVLAAMTMLSLGAQERMNVVLKEGTVQNFNLFEVEQVVGFVDSIRKLIRELG